MTPVSIDYTNMMAPSLGGGGLAAEELDGRLADRFRNAHREVEDRRASGEMGFFDLPEANDTARAVQELADSVGQWACQAFDLGVNLNAVNNDGLSDAGEAGTGVASQGDTTAYDQESDAPGDINEDLGETQQDSVSLTAAPQPL